MMATEGVDVALQEGLDGDFAMFIWLAFVELKLPQFHLQIRL